MSEDTVGCVVAVVAMIAGGYWAYSHYEIKKRAPEPTVEVPAYRPPRPTGLNTVSIGQDGAVWRVDSDSVRGPRGKRQGWAMVDNAKVKGAPSKESRQLILVDCETTASRMLTLTAYNKKGDVLSTSSYSPEKAEIEYYSPGTIGARVNDFLCDARFDAPAKP